jgi:hypothetical protein
MTATNTNGINVRSGRPYMRALANLKARGEEQQCWSCGKTLYASLPKGHSRSITLGHYVAYEDGGDLLDPANHGPQCMTCNYRDGQARATRNRARRRHLIAFINNNY